MTGPRKRRLLIVKEVFRPGDYIIGAAIMNIGLATTSVVQPYIATLKNYSIAGPLGSLISGIGLLLLGYYWRSDKKINQRDL